MVRHKVRIHFRKAGDLRLVSHHDLLRCFERMLRRAGLAFQSSHGFNPRPRLVFALSLPLGVVGRDEVADLELREDVDPDEVRARLTSQCPAGLEILAVDRTDARAAPQVRLASYRVPLPAGVPDDLAGGVAGLLAAAECWVERTRPHHRRFDLRPFLADLRLLPDALEMDLRVTPRGSARPEEVLDVLGLGDPVASGAVVERTRLELAEANSPPNLPPRTGPGTPPAPGAPMGIDTPLSETGACPPGGADLREGSA
jgi:radical SAM-linked protein